MPVILDETSRQVRAVEALYGGGIDTGSLSEPNNAEWFEDEG